MRRGHANACYKDIEDRHAVWESSDCKGIPQVRGLSFIPSIIWTKDAAATEKALKLAIAEMYVMGVSTRKVDGNHRAS